MRTTPTTPPAATPTIFTDDFNADRFFSAVRWHTHRGPWLGWGPLRKVAVGFPIKLSSDQSKAPEGFEFGWILRGTGPHCLEPDCEFDMDYAHRMGRREIVELVDLAATKVALAERRSVAA